MKHLFEFLTAVLLLTTASVGWAAQTIGQWGAVHYQNYGKAEGRTIPANGDYGDYVRQNADLLAAYNATTSGGDGPVSSGCYGDYVRQYADLLAQYNAVGGGQSIEKWGKSHYDAWGREEGRTLSVSCDGVGGAATSTATEGCYGDYVHAYRDLLAAYNASGGVQSIEDWGKTHYLGFGRAESRSACKPDDDYQYLYDHNASLLGGRTLRWNSTTIQVSGAVSSWRQAVNRWSIVTDINLVHVDSTPAKGLGFEIIGYVTDLSDRTCGSAAATYWPSSSTRATCKIKINANIGDLSCNEDWVITHEVGHCLGFLGHTNDGGRMDAAGGSYEITTPVRNMINLLYSLPPGTNILSKL